MAKGSNNVNPKRSHLYKPYNSANSSLFSRLTSRVSDVLPQPTSWLRRWTAPVDQHNYRAEINNDDEEDRSGQQQPPSKKICVRPPSNDVSTQHNQNHVRQIRGDPELSPILRNRADHLDGVVAGPSGLNLRGANFVASTPAVQVPTEAPVKVNGDEGSDGSESTSGCSSLVPQGERTLTVPFVENTPKPSPETPTLSISSSRLGGRGLTPKNRSMDVSYSFSKSRPAFDAYAFNNPLNKSSSINSSMNRTLDDSTNSPFYRGRTMYGGSSSCRESLSLSLTSPKVGTPRHVSVRPTPMPVQNRDTISTSALKILRAIEQFSTPVLDTKKIPMKSESERRKRKAPQPFEDLVIPTMPDLLRIKRKERSQSESSGAPSTPSTATTPKPYQLPPPVQPLSSRDDASEPKLVMKGKNAEAMKSEQVEKVNLPSIPLPIKNLPSFSHMSSLPTSSTYSTPATASCASFSSKPTLTTSPSQASPLFSFGPPKTNESKFKFSEPLVEDGPVPTRCVKPNMKFSDPLDAFAPAPISKEPSTTAAPQDVSVVPPKTIPTVNFSSTSSAFQPKLKATQNSVSSLKTSPDNNAGSVADFFNKNKTNSKEDVKDTSKGLSELFKPASGSWTCDTCLVSNSADKSKCSCCETPKPSKKESPPVNAVSALSPKTWSCSKCSYKNEESAEKCVCGLKKGEKSTVPPLSSLKEFAKAPSDTWECKECFVRNKNSDSSCVACSTAKPGAAVAVAKPLSSLSAMFKKPEGNWECSVCMVSNKSADSACVACGTTKPGAAPAPKAKPAFSFGIPPATATSNVSTASSATTSSSTTTVAAASSFSFGVPPKAAEEPKTNSSSGFGGFKFGVPATTTATAKRPAEDTNEKPNVVPASTFTFGSATSQASKKLESVPTVVIDDDDDDNEVPPKKRVSFGAPAEKVAKPVENAANSESDKPPPTFSFGATKTEPSTTMFQFAGGATTTSSAFGSSSGAASSSTDAKTSSETAFRFGSSSTGVSSSTDPTTTASVVPTPTATTVASGFGMFANVATNASKSLFPPAENKAETSFGISTNNKPTFSSEPKAFGFGMNNDVADTSKVGSGSTLFGKRESNTLFGMPPPPDNKSFLKSTDNKSGFFNSESNENKNIFAAAKPIPAFSSNTNSVFELKPASTVGNSTAFNSTPVAPATVFGSQTAILNNSEQKPMTFGAMQSTPSSDAPFMFKGNDQAPTPSGGFSFSAPAPAQPAAPQNAFSFNAPETPKFGGTVTNSAPTPLFGTTSLAPIFNNPTPSPAPFGFGAAQPVEQPAPAFGFSAAAQPQTAASPFSFNVQNSMSTPTPAQPTTFDPNVKPCFNFTGGATPNFAATPSISAETKQPDRKIRKALRRTQIPR